MTKAPGLLTLIWEATLLAPVIDFHKGRRVADVDLLADEGVGDAVIGLLDVDMIIDVDGGFLPGGDAVALLRQWTQRRFVDLQKEVAPGFVDRRSWAFRSASLSPPRWPR